eukprot:scaffold17957_cov79-Cyclotella_meneghiniana.AAC.7
MSPYVNNNRKIRRIGQILALVSIRLENGFSATLSAGFTGPYHADGNLFTLEAKSNQVSIEGLDINVDAGATTIEVYSRPGDIVINNYDGGWFLMQTVQVAGQGKGNATPLPDFPVQVIIPANSKQSFYVTSTDEKDVWYDIGQQVGRSYASDGNLDILDGYALGYGFVGSSGPRRWNGNVRYSSSGGEPPQPPTANPTPIPTLSPSPKPTAYPTLLPTAKFTMEPTSRATTSPTSSPSQNPVTLPPISPPPISPHENTDGPTRSPSMPPVTSAPSSSSPTMNPTKKAPVPTPTSSSSHRMYSGFVIATSIIFLWQCGV